MVVDSDKDGRDALKTISREDGEFKDRLFELKEIVKLQKKIATLEDLFPEELVSSCAKDLYGLNIGPSEDRAILEHIKEIKVRNSIHDDGKLENLKKSLITKVIEDVNSNNIDEIKGKYPLYIEFVKNMHERIKELT